MKAAPAVEALGGRRAVGAGSRQGTAGARRKGIPVLFTEVAQSWLGLCLERVLLKAKEAGNLHNLGLGLSVGFSTGGATASSACCR